MATRTILIISLLCPCLSPLNAFGNEGTDSPDSCVALERLKVSNEDRSKVYAYIRSAVASVKQSWLSQPPAWVASITKPEQVLVEFSILRDGQIDEISVTQSSSDSLMDQAAMDSIQRASPLSPIPTEFATKCVSLRLGFNYSPGREISITSGGVYRVGGGVSAPKAIFAPDPAYTNQARKAKLQGVCLLALIVRADGTPDDIRVVRSIDKGLDEKAIEAVKQWKFEPAMKDGKPVSVAINVEVNFRLY